MNRSELYASAWPTTNAVGTIGSIVQHIVTGAPTSDAACRILQEMDAWACSLDDTLTALSLSVPEEESDVVEKSCAELSILRGIASAAVNAMNRETLHECREKKQQCSPD